MKRVWIKYYGVLPITKRGYLITTAVAGAAAALMISLAFLLGKAPPWILPWEVETRLPGSGLGVWIYNDFWNIAIVGIILEALDMYMVLRRFGQLGAEQRDRVFAAPPIKPAS